MGGKEKRGSTIAVGFATGRVLMDPRLLLHQGRGGAGLIAAWPGVFVWGGDGSVTLMSR